MRLIGSTFQQPIRSPGSDIPGTPPPLTSAERNRRWKARKRGEIAPFRWIDPDFWANATNGDGCWEWQRGRTRGGYGRLRVNGVGVNANRVALELSLGRPLAPGMFACHTCDNPPCVRPDHLFEGTTTVNQRDAIAKDRKNFHLVTGERNGKARLTALQVASIRSRHAAGERASVLARALGVHRSTIGDVLTGRTWSASAAAELPGRSHG